jgi:hypothetical protein
MSIVDELVANAGLYLGIDTVRGDERGGERQGAARIAITRLPGNEGVALDYEIFNTISPEHVRGHVEHTMIGRTEDGGAVMVCASGHAKSVHVMRETEHGVFEVVGDEPSPYPAKVVIAFPEPGTIRHSWWYGAPDTGPIERDVTVAKLQG